MGDATYGPGRSGASFVFDGDRDGVMVGIGTNLHLQNFTIEAWIKRASKTVVSFNGNSNAELFVVGTHPGGLGLGIQEPGSRLVLRKSGGSHVLTDASITDTNWYHIGISKEQSRIVFYLNGLPILSATFDPGPFTFAAPACIGGWYNEEGKLDNSFYGSIDELTVYNRALTPSEMAAIFVAGEVGKCPVAIPLPACLQTFPGLLGWWCGEGNADDTVGANHGTPLGCVEFGPGKVGRGFAFCGKDGGVSLATTAGLRLQDFSIEAWIKRASSSVVSFDTNGIAEVFSVGSTAGGYGLRLQTDGRITFGNEEVGEAVARVKLTDTEWHHIVVTKFGSSLVFYVDAVPYIAATYDSQGFMFTDYAFIGARWNRFNRLDRSFFGSIDEVSFYARPLTAVEILSLYNSGSAGKCLPLIPPTVTMQPSSGMATEDDCVKLAVAAVGTPPLSFQWLRYGYPITGATGVSLILPRVQLEDSGVYAVKLTSSLGSVMSSNAQLQVKPLPDCFRTSYGLVNWWAAEQDTSDSVNGLSGRLMNGGGFSTGKIGTAFSFNGDNQFVMVPNSATINPSNAMTLECWVYVEQHSTDPVVVIVSKDHPTSRSHQYGLGLKNMGTGRWLFAAQLSLPTGNALLHATTPIDLQKWYHVALTYDAVSIRLFVNGDLEVRVNATGPIAIQTHPLVIGGHGTRQWSLNGRVDELSLYHRALTQDEIRSIYLAGGAGKCPLPVAPVALPSGLIGWWRGESNSLDSVAVQPESAGQASFVRGQVGSAFRFSSDALPIRITNAASATHHSALTLACWVKPEICPTTLWSCIVGRPLQVPESFQYALEWTCTTGHATFRARTQLTGGEVLVESTSATALDSWCHVAMTYEGNELRLYVNGVLEGRCPSRGSLARTESPLLLGGAGTNNAGFVGSLDEASLYNRALSSSEIAEIFIAGKAGKSITDTPFTVRDLQKWLFGSKSNPTLVTEK